jgi:hypothetical protein
MLEERKNPSGINFDGLTKMSMSDTRTPTCPRQVWMSPLMFHALMTRRGRIGLLVTVTVIFAAIAIFGRLYGQHLAYQAMKDRDRAIQKLEIQSQQLEAQRSSQDAQTSELKAEVARLGALLNAMVPSRDAYSINPNQSLIVGDGRLTIGLIGGPLTNGINLNVNGKQHFLAVGDVIHVAVDGSTTCDVQVQSFDMFKAVFTASCNTPKS